MMPEGEKNLWGWVGVVLGGGVICSPLVGIGLTDLQYWRGQCPPPLVPASLHRSNRGVTIGKTEMLPKFSSRFAKNPYANRSHQTKFCFFELYWEKLRLRPWVTYHFAQDRYKINLHFIVWML